MEDIELLKREWKQKYGEVYSVVVDGISYFFRTITRKEYEEIKELALDEFMMEEDIINKALLYPPLNLDTSPPGLVTNLVGEILAVSGILVNLDPQSKKVVRDVLGEKVTKYFKELENPEKIANVLIAYTYKLRLEDVETMNIDTWAKYYTSAQFIAVNFMGIPADVLEAILDPKIAEKKKKKQLERTAAGRVAALKLINKQKVNATDIDPTVMTPEKVRTPINLNSPASDLPPWLREDI